MSFDNTFESRFGQVVEKAEQEYKNRVSRRPSSSPFGLSIKDYCFDLGDGAKERAALDYFGTLLLFFIREYSSEAGSNSLLRRVNKAVVGLRKVTLEHRWPKPMPPHPSWVAAVGKKFDKEIIRWLEAQPEWREYEARVLPQIPVPTDYAGDPPNDTPLYYFRHWPLTGMPAAALTRIKADLMEIHGAFLDKAIQERADCWRRAYDSIAQQFQAAHLLSNEVVEHHIPKIVADASASAGWFREVWGQFRPSAIFSEPLGARFYLPWRVDEFLDALTGRITHWRGQMLLTSGDQHRNEGKFGVSPLSVPAGTRWQDLLIELADGTITIKIRGFEKQMNFADAGFGERDRRLETLRVLAAGRGNLDPDRVPKCLQGKTPLKNRVNLLRTHLKHLLSIDGNPIQHRRAAGIYVSNFQIRLAGAGLFPTPAGASWLDFRFVRRRDGRLAVVVNEKKSFRAQAAERGSGRRIEEVAERQEPVSRIFSFEEIGLRDSHGKLSLEGAVLVELLKAEGKLKRAGDDMAILKLGEWLRNWTSLGGDPLQYADRSQIWTACFECATEQTD